jgi:glycosyltransferase involved in cell wall biosynthesis
LRILYVQYTNPAAYPPLEHSSRILARAGWKVLFLGTGAHGAGALRFPECDGITVRQLSFCPAGWRQKFHYLGFCLWVFLWTLWWRPRWVYASDPLASPVALLLSYLPGTSVLYHEHDSISGPAESGFLRLALWARKRLAGRAGLCVLPNEARARTFTADVGNHSEVITVWNCPLREEVREARPPKHDDTLKVYYHGNLGPLYLPVTVLEALARLPGQVRLRIIGYETVGTRGYGEQLEQAAKRLGVLDRVEILAPLPRYRLWPHCGECDVGLALIPLDDGDLNNRHKLGASNRPFDYLACGLALLVSDLPEWRHAYVEPGYGLACNPEDAQSVAKTLRWYLDNPEMLRSMGERGRQRVLQDWNYETSFAPAFRALTGGG